MPSKGRSVGLRLKAILERYPPGTIPGPYRATAPRDKLSALIQHG
jgi:hypothetical protein